MSDAQDVVATPVVVTTQFRGPPSSGNGGYVCGLLARALDRPRVTVVLRAPIPIDQTLTLRVQDGVARLVGDGDQLIAEARDASDEALGELPRLPTWDEALAAGPEFIGLKRRFHPICFTCADSLEEGYGLRVFVGQVAGREPGLCAGVWTGHANFADPDGLISHEALWGALDCPGSVAWATTEGGGGLLGTITGEVSRRPRAGEATMVLAWQIETSGRKRIAGTAMLTSQGEVLAVTRQVWISMTPRPAPASA